jgi:hypothetical protein
MAAAFAYFRSWRAITMRWIWFVLSYIWVFSVDGIRSAYQAAWMHKSTVALASAVIAGLSLKSGKRSEQLAARSALAAERSAASDEAALEIGAAQHHQRRRPRLTGRISTPYRNEAWLTVTLSSEDQRLTNLKLTMRPEQHVWFADAPGASITGPVTRISYPDGSHIEVSPGASASFAIFLDGMQGDQIVVDATCYRRRDLDRSDDGPDRRRGERDHRRQFLPA